MILSISKAAYQDLDEIYRFSLENWSEKQANKYFTMLYDDFYKLLNQPKFGTTAKELGDNIRTILSGSHLIIYRPKADELQILRIVHAAMDPNEYL